MTVTSKVEHYSCKLDYKNGHIKIIFQVKTQSFFPEISLHVCIFLVVGLFFHNKIIRHYVLVSVAKIMYM